MRHIGLVVNPIAGMGGRVGLKGTDGKVREARELGAEPRSPDRAREAVDSLYANDDVELYTYAAPMGAEIAREAGFEPIVVGEPAGEETSAADTREAVRAFVDAGVDLILFAGGDGTAVDIAETLDECEAEIPIWGIPAGVKVYSGVFAVSPPAAGRVAATYSETEQAEVNDIDEDQYREGEVHTELRALADVPAVEDRQGSKQLASGTVDGLAERIAASVTPDVTYVLGPGSTVGTVAEKLDIEYTPLGVDVYRNGDILVADASEAEILDALGDENTIIVSPIGGQGFVFGRGNDQISPAVIRKSDVEIVASRRKLDDLGVLRVDTGDDSLDESLRGWHRVLVGRHERRLIEIV